MPFAGKGKRRKSYSTCLLYFLRVSLSLETNCHHPAEALARRQGRGAIPARWLCLSLLNVLFNLLNSILFFFVLCVCVHVWICAWGGTGASVGQNGLSVSSPGTGITGDDESSDLDGNPTQVPWKSGMCSSTPSHLSSLSAQPAFSSIRPIFTRTIFFHNKTKKGILPPFPQKMGESLTVGKRRGRESALSIHQEFPAECLTGQRFWESNFYCFFKI